MQIKCFILCLCSEKGDVLSNCQQFLQSFAVTNRALTQIVNIYITQLLFIWHLMPKINIKQHTFSCVTTYHCYVLSFWENFLCINIYANSTFFPSHVLYKRNKYGKLSFTFLGNAWHFEEKTLILFQFNEQSQT